MMYHKLVISGGDIKGIYALGALQYIYENYLPQMRDVKSYIGTSIGALICYLLVIGYTPLELIDYIVHSTFLDDLKSLNIANIIQRKGLVNYYIIQEHLETLTIKKIGKFYTLGDLYLNRGLELVCTTYNFTTGEVEYLSYKTNPDLPALTAVRMSCNIPILFDRFYYNGCEYIDGGFADNFPLDYAIKDVTHEKVLGLYLDGKLRKADSSDDKNIAKFIIHLLLLPSHIDKSSKIEKYSKDHDIISISSENLQLLEFDLNISQRLDLVSVGIKSAKTFYEEKKERQSNEHLEVDLEKIKELIHLEFKKTIEPRLLREIVGGINTGAMSYTSPSLNIHPSTSLVLQPSTSLLLQSGQRPGLSTSSTLIHDPDRERYPSIPHHSLDKGSQESHTSLDVQEELSGVEASPSRPVEE